MPLLSCSKCHSQGGARLLLLVIVAVFLVAVVLMFARDWGSPAADTSGSGWTVKLKIVITHLQVDALPESTVDRLAFIWGICSQQQHHLEQELPLRRSCVPSGWNRMCGSRVFKWYVLFSADPGAVQGLRPGVAAGDQQRHVVERHRQPGHHRDRALLLLGGLRLLPVLDHHHGAAGGLHTIK